MPGIYYAAVEDDPLTSGPGSRVFASERTGTIQGEDGKRRRMAFIGDKAYCQKCHSEGIIIGGAGVRENGRLIDRQHGGRLQAVGGDEVLCKCPVRPRIVAVYGRSWKIRDSGEETRATVATGMDSSREPAHAARYDEQFTLLDDARRPFSNMCYRIVTDSGQVFTGTTNAAGQTQRVLTRGSSNLKLQLEKQ